MFDFLSVNFPFLSKFFHKNSPCFPLFTGISTEEKLVEFKPENPCFVFGFNQTSSFVCCFYPGSSPILVWCVWVAHRGGGHIRTCCEVGTSRQTAGPGATCPRVVVPPPPSARVNLSPPATCYPALFWSACYVTTCHQGGRMGQSARCDAFWVLCSPPKKDQTGPGFDCARGGGWKIGPDSQLSLGGGDRLR